MVYIFINNKKMELDRKFGNRIDKRGHIRKDGRIRKEETEKQQTEHRFIMEKYLGRKLLFNEVIGHKDGNPSNNDKNNLELFSNNSGHIIQHHKEGTYDKHLSELHQIEKLRGDDGRWLKKQQKGCVSFVKR